MNFLKAVNNVEVGDQLTTVIDWVSIENLGGFVVMVENLGGGTAGDITDVVIDTSIDGGETVLEDQYDGYPTVPIAAGKAAGTNQNAADVYVRVRAKCATGEDTTAKVYVITELSDGNICLLSDVKDRLEMTAETKHDDRLRRIIAGVEQLFENWCRRKLIMNTSDITEYYTGLGSRLQLKRYPVISITSVKEAWDYDFDNADELVADVDYRLVGGGDKGIIYKMYGTFKALPDSVQVIYRGGYAPAGASLGENEIAMPADLREAAIIQAALVFNRRDDMGVGGLSFDGGGFQKIDSTEICRPAKEILEHYKRRSLI